MDSSMKKQALSLLSLPVLGFALAGLIVTKIIYAFFFHPLRHIPGPALAKVTDIWHLYHCWGGKRHHVLVALHKKYGPYVRVGPNMVSTNSSSAIPAIYAAGAPALKSPFYGAFAPGMPSSFTTNDKLYRNKKQILSAAFAPRKLESMEPLIRQHIDTFCETIATAGKVDIAVMLGSLSIDVLSDLCFGKCFNTMNNVQERDRILEAMEKSVELVIRVSTPQLQPRAHKLTSLQEGTMHKWPRAVWKVLHSKEKVMKRGYVYQVCLSCSRLHSLILTIPRIKKAAEAMMEQMNRKSEREDFFTNILQARHPETGLPYPKPELMGEAILLLSVLLRLMNPMYSVAGSDTTSTALTVILWHLLANPKTMEKLTAEIRGNFKSTDEIKYQTLQGLPYLHSVIEEGLRICPPNPGLIPRMVVDRAPGHLAIDGRIFPPGTEIGVCNMSLHHNPLYFDDPDNFIPERWMPDSNIKCDKAAFSPFSYGPRSCLGRNMAYMEMSLTLALLVFRVKLSFGDHAKEMNAGFDVEDAFVAIKPSVPVRVTRA
ncbi:Cytochrome P450 E-class group I [Penicillium concentricum]|uniref:Cytochrome P450 E-class group I n=1 Tax=Penicillium concentricum TaxID=293559 RepID=A0A9W9SSC3_9EURO|nr:Cytochrome P450 E-class group I [Penicillium concentricum]KAJ5383808.1 Cytochrome P450 E-class group I [Penicillium concentricum]